MGKRPETERPDVEPENRVVYRLFSTLNASRAGDAPLAMADMLALLALYGYQGGAAEEILELLQDMDAVYLKERAKDGGRNQNRGGQQRGKTRRR